MKINAVIASTVLIILAGCSHLKPEPDSGLVTEPLINEAVINQDSETEVTEPVNAPTEVAELSAEPVELDLLQRIEAGFQLPDFKSKYIADYERWNATHPTYLRNLFARAEPFLFHIVEEIEKRGMPMELALLPAIESAYKPNAKSRSSASGLWQFVPATGRDFSLNEDWWYDSRRDVLASTDAALTYLDRLNKMFDGDWFLALAAYNGGPGTVRRAIKSNRKKNRATDYQSLRLRAETRRYVPKLIALKNIISNPQKYQVKLPTLSNQKKFEIVTLPGQIDLHAFADSTGIDFNQLMHLNAGNKRWATSPNGPKRIIVPLGKSSSDNAQTLARAQAYLAQAPKLNYRNHRIDNGDSLSTIARRYGVSVAAIKSSNNLHSSRIRAGKNLLIPVKSNVVSNSAADTTRLTGRAVNTDTTMVNPEPKKVVHRVKKGDTLWSIARFYQVQLQELLTWNNLSSEQVLSLDQALLVFKK